MFIWVVVSDDKCGQDKSPAQLQNYDRAKRREKMEQRAGGKIEEREEKGRETQFIKSKSLEVSISKTTECPMLYAMQQHNIKK